VNKTISKAQLQEAVHTALCLQRPNKSIFSDCLEWLYAKSGCLRSVGR